MHYSELIIFFYLKKYRLNITGYNILKPIDMDEGFKKYRYLSKPQNKFVMLDSSHIGFNNSHFPKSTP